MLHRVNKILVFETISVKNIIPKTDMEKQQKKFMITRNDHDV